MNLTSYTPVYPPRIPTPSKSKALMSSREASTRSNGRCYMDPPVSTCTASTLPPPLPATSVRITLRTSPLSSPRINKKTTCNGWILRTSQPCAFYFKHCPVRLSLLLAFLVSVLINLHIYGFFGLCSDQFTYLWDVFFIFLCRCSAVSVPPPRRPSSSLPLQFLYQWYLVDGVYSLWSNFNDSEFRLNYLVSLWILNTIELHCFLLIYS